MADVSEKDATAKKKQKNRGVKHKAQQQAKQEGYRSWRVEMREAQKKKKLEARIQGSGSQAYEKWQERQGVETEAPKKKKKGVAQEDDAEAEAEPPKKVKRTSQDLNSAGTEEAPFSDPEAFKVCIAGLPFNVDDKIVRRDFSECGEVVNVRLLKDRTTGTSRGIAFVSFTNQHALDEALKFNGTDYGGRSLWVKIADSGQGDSGEAKGGGKGKDKGKGKGKIPPLGERPAGCLTVILKGLAYSVTKADLQESFKSCGSGPTNIDILTDRDTGNSRGIGFLDFESEAAVDDAIKLNGTELKGRRFSMDFVAPREKAKAPGAKPTGCTCILVKGLAYTVTDKDLREAFEPCGAVMNVRIVLDKATGESRGMGFVDFDNDAAVVEAVKLHGTELQGRRLILDYATPLESRDTGSSIADGGPGNNSAGKERKRERNSDKPKVKPEGCTSVVLKELAEEISESRLMKTFKDCDGGPRSINIVLDKDTGAHTGIAFVNFASEEAVDEAMELDGTRVKGHKLSIGYVKPKKPRAKQ